MATNYDTLKTTWTTSIETAYTAGSLSAAEYYEALIALDHWIAALTKLASVVDTDIQSYSLANRSVTRRGAEDFRLEVRRARTELMGLLYGHVTLADFRVDFDTEATT